MGVETQGRWRQSLTLYEPIKLNIIQKSTEWFGNLILEMENV